MVKEEGCCFPESAVDIMRMRDEYAMTQMRFAPSNACAHSNASRFG